MDNEILERDADDLVEKDFLSTKVLKLLDIVVI
jgi:hypothetical protein